MPCQSNLPTPWQVTFCPKPLEISRLRFEKSNLPTCHREGGVLRHGTTWHDQRCKAGDQGREDAVQPAADGGQCWCDDFLGEDVREGEVAVLEELATEKSDLFADRCGVRRAHLRGRLNEELRVIRRLDLRTQGREPNCLRRVRPERAENLGVGPAHEWWTPR